MTKTSSSFAETTKTETHDDCLSDALRTMRVSGNLLLRESYAAPWAISIPNAEHLRALLQASPGTRVVAFHFVERGQLEILLKNGDETTLETSELAICFGGAAHQISMGPNPQVLPVDALLAGGENIFRPNEKNQTRSTSLICGVFLLHDTHLNPLFTALPPLLQVAASRPNGFHNLHAVANLISGELSQPSLGSSYRVERLLELLCAEAIRSHLTTHDHLGAGWFKGLKDPNVGRAIAMIHAHPGQTWSVDRLADGVAMSPSRFAARFASALGESPMAYVAKWRMNVAGRLLDRTQRGINDIAADVGYESLAAFNRAFKRHIGVPPGAWRARER